MGPYENLLQCSWMITVPQSCAVVTLFSTVNVLSTDLISVYDGPSSGSPFLGVFAGSHSYLRYQSKGNVMLVSFRSGASGRGSGFVFEYSRK
jgi:hypothetical protein